MAYYGSDTVIEQAVGQTPPSAGAYADGVVGGRPGEPMPGALQAFRDGIFSSLGADETDAQLRTKKLIYAASALALVGVVAFVARRRRRR